MAILRYRRAMMLLASAGGNRVPVIAQLAQADEDTVRDVITYPRALLSASLTYTMKSRASSPQVVPVPAHHAPMVGVFYPISSASTALGSLVSAALTVRLQSSTRTSI